MVSLPRPVATPVYLCQCVPAPATGNHWSSLPGPAWAWGLACKHPVKVPVVGRGHSLVRVQSVTILRNRGGRVGLLLVTGVGYEVSGCLSAIHCVAVFVTRLQTDVLRLQRCTAQTAVLQCLVTSGSQITCEDKSGE